MHSYPTSVDNEILTGTHAAVVGREKQRRTRQIGRRQMPGHALHALDRGFALGVEPQRALLLTQPGTRQLMRMCCAPSLRAMPLTKPRTPALAIAYSGKAAFFRTQLIEPMQMIEPPPSCFMSGTTAWVTNT
jgi:hypothetical protein